MSSSLLYLLFYLVGSLGCLFLALFVVATGYLAYIHWKYDHLPSPKRPSFYFGHLPDIWKFHKDIGEDVPHIVFVDYWAARVDSLTFVVFFAHTPMIVTLDSEVVKVFSMNKDHPKPKLITATTHSPFGKRLFGDGLFSKRFYEQWKPHRSFYDPAFKKAYLKSLVGTFNEITLSTIEKLRPMADGKTSILLKKHIHNLTLDVISKVAFGTDFSKSMTAESLGIELPEGSDCNVFYYVIEQSMKAIFKNLTTPFPFLNQYLYPTEGKIYRKCIAAMRQMGRDCIMNRIEMIEAGKEVPQDILTCILSSGMEKLVIEDMVDDFCTFYLAGQETTANAIIFAVILLFQNPNCMERVEQEIIEVLGERTTVRSSDLEKLQYMDQVLHETLRLYPAPDAIYKSVGSSMTIGKHFFPAGTIVKNLFFQNLSFATAALVVLQHLDLWGVTPQQQGKFKKQPNCVAIELQESNMCRMERYFRNPESFNPDRFHPSKEKPNSFAYFPFGTGHRSCIGKSLALMEAKVALALLLQTFQIRLPPDYEIQMIQKLTLQTKDDVPCTMILK